MSEMIDRAGTAVVEALESLHVPEISVALKALEADHGVNLKRFLGRAAIEAMREVNEPLLDAGTAVLWPYLARLGNAGSTAVAVWDAMHDAALAE